MDFQRAWFFPTCPFPGLHQWAAGFADKNSEGRRRSGSGTWFYMHPRLLHPWQWPGNWCMICISLRRCTPGWLTWCSMQPSLRVILDTLLKESGPEATSIPLGSAEWCLIWARQTLVSSSSSYFSLGFFFSFPTLPVSSVLLSVLVENDSWEIRSVDLWKMSRRLMRPRLTCTGEDYIPSSVAADWLTPHFLMVSYSKTPTSEQDLFDNASFTLTHHVPSGSQAPCPDLLCLAVSSNWVYSEW
jgi:hypothetical protein